MKSSKVTFEWVGDIHYKYPYMCVYDDMDEINPFMEIAINENKEIEFNIYKNQRQINISMTDIQLIIEKAKEFKPKALACGD